MIINHLTIIVSFIMLLLMALTMPLSAQYAKPIISKTNTMEQQNKFTGMWVTRDGYIRQELLPAGRYDEARGSRKSAYTGRYEITGNHIKYWDDTGFTATGDFQGNDVLFHGGYTFYRESNSRTNG